MGLYVYICTVGWDIKRVDDDGRRRSGSAMSQPMHSFTLINMHLPSKVVPNFAIAMGIAWSVRKDQCQEYSRLARWGRWGDEGHDASPLFSLFLSQFGPLLIITLSCLLICLFTIGTYAVMQKLFTFFSLVFKSFQRGLETMPM